MASELESLRVDNIDIGGRNSKDNTVWFCDILRNEVASLLLDIGGLIADGDLASRDDELVGGTEKYNLACGSSAPWSNQVNQRESG